MSHFVKVINEKSNTTKNSFRVQWVYIYIALLSHAWGDITYSNYYKQLLQNVTWEQLPLFICKINTCTIREDSSGHS
jgi:hypothetical protein